MEDAKKIIKPDSDKIFAAVAAYMIIIYVSIKIAQYSNFYYTNGLNGFSTSISFAAYAIAIYPAMCFMVFMWGKVKGINNK